MNNELQKTITAAEQAETLEILKHRFEKNMQRHEAVSWDAVYQKLKAHPHKIVSLHAMEKTGGEPDVIRHERNPDRYTFCDCSAESPTGRRSLCFDTEALHDRKENKPAGSAVEMAAEMGISLLTELQYRDLQTLGNFDLKTSSWLQTPASIRSLGGAIFGDRRYDTVFIYHNGAQSYYAARGFRGILIV